VGTIQVGTVGGCVANCPSHSTTWNTGTISPGVTITYQHFQEIKDALHAERKRRYANSNLANYTYSEVVYAGNIITNDTISRFKKYMDDLKAYNYINADPTRYPSASNGSLTWVYANYWNSSNTGDTYNKVSEKEILANSILELRTNINDLNNDCICNCNYCTCNCNYCTCNCNYCTCVCNYCTCQCNYCTCNCNYCTCVCNYCTCNCNYCTCQCNYRSCSCDGHNQSC
jgi:hypothetical protein